MPLEKNDLGGINDTDYDAEQRAKKADLVTLPEGVKGTNCSNCKWIDTVAKPFGRLCRHPKVKQYVNQRMCCALWSNKGMYTPFKRDKDYE